MAVVSFSDVKSKKEKFVRTDFPTMRVELHQRGISVGLVKAFTRLLQQMASADLQEHGRDFASLTTGEVVHGLLCSNDGTTKSEGVEQAAEDDYDSDYEEGDMHDSELKCSKLKRSVSSSDSDEAALKYEWSIRTRTMEGKDSFVEFLRGRAGASGLKKALKEFTTLSEDKWFDKADYFISHAWNQPFMHIVTALEDAGLTDKDYIWLDIFAVNQHFHEGMNQDELNGRKDATAEMILKTEVYGMRKVIDHVKKLILIYTPFQKPAVLGRGWCWAEIGSAITSDIPVQLGLTADGRKACDELTKSFDVKSNLDATEKESKKAIFKDILQSINASTLQCFKKEDELAIKRELRSYGNGIDFTGAQNRMKWAIAYLFMYSAQNIDANEDGIRYSAGKMGLHESILEILGPDTCSMERSNLLYKLATQASAKGDKSKAMQYCTDAIKSLTLHLNHLPSLKNEALVQYRVTQFVKLGKFYALQSRLYCDLFSKDLFKQSLQSGRKALGMLNDAKNLMHEGWFENDRGVKIVRARVYYTRARLIATQHENYPKAREGKLKMDLLFGMKQVDDAISLFQNIIDDNGEHTSVGSCLVMKAKLVDLARQHEFEDLLESWSNDSVTQNLFADLDLSEGWSIAATTELFKRGIQIQKQLGERDARVSMTLQSLAWHHMIHGNYVEAIECLCEALLDPNRGYLIALVEHRLPAKRIVYWANMLKDSCAKVLSQSQEFETLDQMLAFSVDGLERRIEGFDNLTFKDLLLRAKVETQRTFDNPEFSYLRKDKNDRDVNKVVSFFGIA